MQGYLSKVKLQYSSPLSLPLLYQYHLVLSRGDWHRQLITRLLLRNTASMMKG